MTVPAAVIRGVCLTVLRLMRSVLSVVLGVAAAVGQIGVGGVLSF